MFSTSFINEKTKYTTYKYKSPNDLAVRHNKLNNIKTQPTCARLICGKIIMEKKLWFRVRQHSCCCIFCIAGIFDGCRANRTSNIQQEKKRNEKWIKNVHSRQPESRCNIRTWFFITSLTIGRSKKLQGSYKLKSNWHAKNKMHTAKYNSMFL